MLSIHSNQGNAFSYLVLIFKLFLSLFVFYCWVLQSLNTLDNYAFIRLSALENISSHPLLYLFSVFIQAFTKLLFLILMRYHFNSSTLCGTGDWTQGPACARQVLHQWATPSGLVLSIWCQFWVLFAELETLNFTHYFPPKFYVFTFDT